MTIPYTVALVADPDFGAHLKAVSDRVHTWIIATPNNYAAAKQIWSTLPENGGYSIERGVTVFDLNLMNDEADGWRDTLESLELHHNHYSHNPGYSVLEVYGTSVSELLRPLLEELGFSRFDQTDYGFRALE